jgi:hypothetical protein
MLTQKIRLAILFALLFMFVADAQSQQKSIQLKFQIDGKTITKTARVDFLVANKTIRAKVRKNAFLVPSEVAEVREFGVRLTFGKRKLIFSPVYKSDLTVRQWIVGIDNKPFDQEYVEPSLAQKLKYLYYITFVSEQGENTRLVIRVYKQPTPEAEQKKDGK